MKRKIIKEEIEQNTKRTKEMARKTIEDYKKFALKGNIMDMAIGVVIGSAFTNIVNVIVSSVISPIISLLTNKIDLTTLFITLHGPKADTIEQAKALGAITLNYGDLLNALLNFFIVSAVLFIVVSILKKSNKKQAKVEEEIQKETTKICPYCMTNIHLEATRCPNCTSKLKNDLIQDIDNSVLEIIEEKNLKK